ncbi:Lar family restriction alleviation protein [Burkholderia gladioli]|uniref:Lar family restriction alleviation protein n=1 Tax=Burkholderia gladioli TaxID=28095 RepID=UPI00163E0AEA|nr:Lar family restriction alleviation protein [Burkholderia gladioli]
MSDKLSDCPFCGNEYTSLNTGGSYYVMCGNCGAEGPWNDDDRDIAIAAWNRRASPAPAIPAAKPRPTAWVRFRSDGGFEGPIMDSDARMCDTRRTCGAWMPLYLDAPAISESEDARKDAEAGFEAFANSYDHDSNEWLDMDAQQTFIHGWNAAIKAGQYVSESKDSSDDNQFFAGVCVALQVLTIHDQGVIWKDIVKACSVDDLLQYAANVETEEWQLAGFAHFARRELGRRKPAARKGEKS